MAFDFNELGRRAAYLRSVYAQYKIPLKTGEGLTDALNQAEVLSKRSRLDPPPTDDEFVAAARSAHTVSALSEFLKVCIDTGLDVSDHLARITTGKTDYGVSSPPADAYKLIYFKDFEFELYIAYCLIKKRIIPEFLPNSNDRRGEMRVGNIFIECKHPDSSKSIERHVKKFNAELTKDGSYGVFAVGLEDAFDYGNSTIFQTEADYEQWYRSKGNEIEKFGLEVVGKAKSYSKIAGMIQSDTQIKNVGKGSQMGRNSNALMFDRKEMDSVSRQNLESIIKVFNDRRKIITV